MSIQESATSLSVTKSSNLKKGILLAFGTALISGVSAFVNKLAVVKIQPLVLTSVKNSLVFGLVIGAFLIFSKPGKLRAISRKNWVRLALIGLVGGALPFYLFFTALTMMPAINAALIHKSLVVWAGIMAFFFLKEKLSALHIVGVGLLLVSNLFIGGFKGLTLGIPELMVLGATLLWSLENIMSKVTLREVDPLIVTGARMGIGSAILMVASLASGNLPVVTSLSLEQWGLIGVTALFLFGYVLTWYSALKYAPVVTVGSVLVSATVVTNILSAVFVTHALSVQQLGQAGVILLGVALVAGATFRAAKAERVKQLSSPQVKI